MNSSILRNLTLDELVNREGVEYAQELHRRLRDDPSLVTDISEWFSEKERDHDVIEAYEEGFDDGIIKGELEGESKGYKEGHEDGSANKKFNEDYR